jgi:glycosyltransferase involved in cell wall biosynthesis
MTAAARGRARLCLNMIVKDEAAIIERCVASIAPVVDWYVVCDTGSSDDTARRIERAFRARGVAGEIHAIPFVDFGTARNRALDLARASAGAFDYLILADADMELVVEDPAFRDALDAPAYRVVQRNGAAYWNTRVVRRDAAARYVGATHEYLALDAAPARLDGIAFVDHANGSSRAHKLERDAALLAAALAADPGDVRAMFYLAQTHRDAGRHAEAREWYRRRAEAGGFDEEVWYALWMHARMSLALGDDVGFVDGCLSAYERRPWRAEPLADLARYYRERGQNETAMLMVEAGERIAYPRDDVLFVDDAVYAHAFRHEASIAGWYSRDAGRRRASREATLELGLRRDVPADVRDNARRNARFHAPEAAALLRCTRVRELAPPMPGEYVPMNPSVWRDGDELHAIVRGVNYRLGDPERSYKLPVIRTHNVMARLDASRAIVESRPLVEVPGLPPALDTRIRGYEDCRLFRLRGRWHATATVRDRDPSTRCQIALLAIDDDWRIASLRVLRGYGDLVDQKNWMPAVDGDELSMVYLCDPTTVLGVDVARGYVKPRSERTPSLALDHQRGGTQLVAFDDGWLCLTHEVIALGGWRRQYLHRFLRFDRAFRIVALTEPFRLGDHEVEFAAGLAWDPRDDALDVSYGVADRRAFVATFDAPSVRRALAALP